MADHGRVLESGAALGGARTARVTGRIDRGALVTGGGELTGWRSPATILALVDMAARDARVVAATRRLAEALGAAVVLLHVARPIPRHDHASREHMASVDAAMHDVLRSLAARSLPPNRDVRTAVRFGETVEQIEKAAIAVGATLVVASSSPARWLWWRSRDRRLRRSLDIPVLLVSAREDETEARARVSGDDSRRLWYGRAA